MTITVTTSNENELGFDAESDTFYMVFDPPQHTAFNHTTNAGFRALIETLGKLAAWRVYPNTIVELTDDNSYWSRDGKWLRKEFFYLDEAKVA